MFKNTSQAMTQINLPLPLKWKNKLEKIAREKAYNENIKFSHLDLMRETLNNSLHLDEGE